MSFLMCKIYVKISLLFLLIQVMPGSIYYRPLRCRANLEHFRSFFFSFLLLDVKLLISYVLGGFHISSPYVSFGVFTWHALSYKLQFFLFGLGHLGS